MSLLAPLYLLGGLALALPLWLHLFRQKNPVKLSFSSLMFFESQMQVALRRRKFRYPFLLAVRLAVCLLLVIVFARPIWERSSQGLLGVVPKFHIIVIDTSMSMQFGNRWDRAVTQAQNIVNAMEPDDIAQVLVNGPGVRLVTERTSNRKELLFAVESMEGGASRNSYGDLIEVVRDLTASDNLQVKVHLVSDFQSSALPSHFSDVTLPGVATLVAHNVADAEAPNWAIESVKGSMQLYGAEQDTRLEVTVRGFGTVSARKRVTLRVGGKRVESRSVEVPESGRASVVFENFDVPKGSTRAELFFDGADSLPLDDRRLVAFDNREPHGILFLSGHRNHRDALYYKVAIGAGSGSMFEVLAVTSEEAARLVPEKFALIVISDVPRLPVLFSKRLRKYVESGGSIFLAVGSKITSAREAPLYGTRIGEARYVPRTGERFQVAGELDLSHPVLRQVERFRHVKFFRYAQLWTGVGDAVTAYFSDGSPMLIEHEMGKGRLLIFSSSLDNVWNDLPLHPIFVPFVVESARYLSGLEGNSMQATIDSILNLRRLSNAGATVQVIDPAGKRLFSLSQSLFEQELLVTDLGFYEIQRDSDSELIAVNPDPRESNLRPMADDVLALWQATGGGHREVGEGVREGEMGRLPSIEFWHWLLLLLVVVTLAESVMGNFHLTEHREVRSL